MAFRISTMKRFGAGWLIFLALMLAASTSATQPFSEPPGDGADAPTAALTEPPTMKIRFIVDGRTIPATLTDNPTSRDFISLLPLTLTLDDYAGTEKIAYLSRKLSGEAAPEGVDPSAGDITYYAPWGNLALFYKDFGYAKGLIKLGSIDQDADPGVQAFDVPGPVTVTIDRRKE